MRCHRLIISSALLVFVLLLAHARAKEVPRFTAAQLLGAYEANEVLCDEKLKGQRITITGNISAIARDLMGSPYVTLKGRAGQFGEVQCFFGEEAKESLLQLRAGQSVAITGTVKGKLMNVLLRECAVSR